MMNGFKLRSAWSVVFVPNAARSEVNDYMCCQLVMNNSFYVFLMKKKSNLHRYGNNWCLN